MLKRMLALAAALCLMVSLARAAEPVAMESAEAIELLSGGTFLTEGTAPMYFKDHTAGHWLYVSDTVRIEITRYRSTSPLMTWYIADLQCAEGSTMYTLSSNDMTGKTNNYPQRIAQAGRAVYAQSSDFYTYRVANDRYPGIIIRNGKILYKKSYSKLVNALPNLATMAFYSSGKAEVNEAWEVTAQEYIDKGAETVVAFGPLLIRDGEIQDVTDDAYQHKEPRCCFGVIGRRHFVGLLVEGRKSHSDGATLAQCAELLADYGCWDAINLDGGNTSAMLFMGESVMLNEMGGVDENDRSIPDVLCLGTY